MKRKKRQRAAEPPWVARALRKLKDAIPVDPGMRKIVAIFLREGVTVMRQSCDGTHRYHAFAEPTIEMDFASLGTMYGAVEICERHRLPLRRVAIVWRATDGWLDGPVVQLIFYRPGEPDSLGYRGEHVP